jgi:hypothetical protein
MSARRTETSKTPETYVVRLITQRRLATSQRVLARASTGRNEDATACGHQNRHPVDRSYLESDDGL